MYGSGNRLFASPGRYLQGPSALDQLGQIVQPFGTRPILVMDEPVCELIGDRVLSQLTAVGLGAEVEYVNLAAGDVNIGKVISQGTPAGTMIAPPTKVVLTVGRDGTIPAG